MKPEGLPSWQVLLGTAALCASSAIQHASCTDGTCVSVRPAPGSRQNHSRAGLARGGSAEGAKISQSELHSTGQRLDRSMGYGEAMEEECMAQAGAQRSWHSRN